MHSKSVNIEIMVGNETNKIIEKLFDELSLTKISKRPRRFSERRQICFL